MMVYMVYIWLMDWDGGSQQLGLGLMSQLLGILMDFGHHLFTAISGGDELDPLSILVG